MFTTELTIEPASPFNFGLSASIFRNGDQHIRFFEEGKFGQVIRLNGNLALLTIESIGSVEQPKLKAQLMSNAAISLICKKEAEEIVNRLFNLELKLAPFYSAIELDETMKKIIPRLYGLQSPTTQTIYEALIDSVVEQQISLQVANSLERKMIKEFGESITIDGAVYYEYPTPHALAQTSIEELKACGLSLRKTEYIKEISALVAEGKLDLEKFRRYEDSQEIVRELDNVRGIGAWTAELTVIRAMQRWDVMPADDIGLRRIISHYYCNDKRISSDEAKKIAEPWGNWRGLAAFYLVMAEILKIEV